MEAYLQISVWNKIEIYDTDFSLTEDRSRLTQKRGDTRWKKELAEQQDYWD